MPTDLVELARFPSSAEASIVRCRLEVEGIRAKLDGEAMASWFWHLGTAIGGVRLLVNEDDVDRALEILKSNTPIDDTGEIDFGDESRDDVSDSEGSELPEALVRAWRASLIGFVLLPPLLHVYSTWLLFRHRFFVGRCRNWRVLATCSANAVFFTFVALVIFLIAKPAPPEPQKLFYFIPNGVPIEAEPLEPTEVERPLFP